MTVSENTNVSIPPLKSNVISLISGSVVSGMNSCTWTGMETGSTGLSAISRMEYESMVRNVVFSFTARVKSALMVFRSSSERVILNTLAFISLVPLGRDSWCVELALLFTSLEA